MRGYKAKVEKRVSLPFVSLSICVGIALERVCHVAVSPKTVFPLYCHLFHPYGYLSLAGPRNSWPAVVKRFSPKMRIVRCLSTAQSVGGSKWKFNQCNIRENSLHRRLFASNTLESNIFFVPNSLCSSFISQCKTYSNRASVSKLLGQPARGPRAGYDAGLLRHSGPDLLPCVTSPRSHSQPCQLSALLHLQLAFRFPFCRRTVSPTGIHTVMSIPLRTSGIYRHLLAHFLLHHPATAFIHRGQVTEISFGLSLSAPLTV